MLVQLVQASLEDQEICSNRPINVISIKKLFNVKKLSPHVSFHSVAHTLQRLLSNVSRTF